MEARKLTSADIDGVRDIEGFPIATDEAIIELSDAPYYTACPNPFIEEFIAENGTPYDETTDEYHREPFASDVSEGKNDPIYNAHSYHTKVPYKAVMHYILHYTKPGDVVFDGFCGTGMTGVAAQMCGTNDMSLRLSIEGDMRDDHVEWGARSAIIGDLSPAATSIASSYNLPVDYQSLVRELDRIQTECEKECSWLYETRHVDNNGSPVRGIDGNPIIGRIINVIWSDVFVCPSCGETFDYWHTAIDSENGQTLDVYRCPRCDSALKKSDCEHDLVTYYDEAIKDTATIAKQIPVVITYVVSGKRYSKAPDEWDKELLARIEQHKISDWFPISELPEGYNTAQPKKSHGLKYVHQFYTKRNLICLSVLNRLIRQSNVRHLMFLLTGLLVRSTKMSRVHIKKYFFGGGGWNGGNLAGTLYVSSTPVETSVLDQIKERSANMKRVFAGYKAEPGRICLSTQSLTDLGNIPDNAIDYIFTDPPFGQNLNYSELSFIWEAWLNVITANKDEAIMNEVQHKGLHEYQQLMKACFESYFRVLKPSRWITIEFHNSKNAVWNAIQESLLQAGFIVADVRTLDKKQGSFKQVNSASAVKQDLVISAYKPKESFQKEFMAAAGTEETAWNFVSQHLSNIPVVVYSAGQIELIAERQAYLLFDRMVAYHVMRGTPVPVDATEFYKGLDDRFLKRDDMFFLPEQVTEYDTARMKMDVEAVQFALLVTNEKTAIGWLYQLLANEPMTYQQIQPMFMQEVKTVDRYEAMPELAVLLEENFLQDDKGRWYIPDTKKEGDIAKLREKSLLREFDGYLKSKGKLKLFRSEAIRVGFSHLWKDKNYQAIVDLANRLPAATIQEDPNLLMYYDISLSRVG